MSDSKGDKKVTGQSHNPQTQTRTVLRRPKNLSIVLETAVYIKGNIIVPNNETRKDKKVTVILKLFKANTVLRFKGSQ